MHSTIIRLYLVLYLVLISAGCSSIVKKYHKMLTQTDKCDRIKSWKEREMCKERAWKNK